MTDRPLHLLIALLVCVALLGAQAVNVHLHLCLDGQAPSASLHYGEDEASPPQHIDVGKIHHDYDIELGAHSFAKPPKIDFTLVALLFPLLLLLVRRELTFLRPASQCISLFSPRHLRPPTCGPPLTSVV